MGLFSIFSGGTKYFDKHIDPKCDYCQFGKRTRDGNKVLCEKRGLVEQTYSCNKFIYSPLKRIPVKQLNFVGSIADDDIYIESKSDREEKEEANNSNKPDAEEGSDSSDETEADDSESNNEPETAEETESNAESEAEVETESNAESETAVEAESNAEPETAEETESNAEPETAEETESNAEPETAEETESNAEPETAEETESNAEPDSDPVNKNTETNIDNNSAVNEKSDKIISKAE